MTQYKKASGGTDECTSKQAQYIRMMVERQGLTHPPWNQISHLSRTEASRLIDDLINKRTQNIEIGW